MASAKRVLTLAMQSYEGRVAELPTCIGLHPENLQAPRGLLERILRSKRIDYPQNMCILYSVVSRNRF